jgi:endonuclease/exonuclease/phosphatase family metal-dependent hydrolase
VATWKPLFTLLPEITMPTWFQSACLALCLITSLPARSDTQLTVMSFNTWGAGTNAGKSIDETVAVIRAANPDIIGLQEIRPESATCEAEHCPAGPQSVAPQLAAALGYELLEQLADNEVLWANAILSRYPIRAATPGGLGARIDVNGREVLLFNIHTTDYPYGPFQLLSIPYGQATFLDTADQAIDAAWQARRKAFELLSADLATAGDAAAVFITGDFNEPSFRDWTAAAAAAGIHPVEVAWPFTHAVEGLGFTDVFRAAHPDPLLKPGFTWSPNITPATQDDHRDRIDFIFARGENLLIDSAAVIGESGPWSDIAVDPFPSDHRAVVATVRF